MKTARLDWLDAAKGIAIILVAAGHVTSNYVTGEPEAVSPAFHTLHWFIYSFHMPLFLVISGFLFKSSLKKDAKKTAVSKLIAYGVPYLAFSFLYWAVKAAAGALAHSGAGIKDILLIPLFPLSFMWYLYALLLMAELTLFLAKTVKNRTFIFAAALVLRILWEILTIGGRLKGSWMNDLIFTDFIKNYLWFALGLVYGKDLFALLRRLPDRLKLVCSAFLFLLNALAAELGLVPLPFFRMTWALTGTAAAFLLSMVISRNRLLGYLGRNTLPVYLIHGTVISVMKNAFSKLGVPLLGGALPLAVFTAASVGISLGVYSVCKKISLSDLFFYPNKYIKMEQEVQYDKWFSFGCHSHIQAQ